MSNASNVTWKERLATYRPGLDRAIFAFALLGVLVTVHLWIQQGRGFDRGCLGFSEPVPAATVDCNAVVQSSAGTLFGVSNVVLGIAFYLVLVGLSLGVAYAAGPTRGRLKQLRTAVVTGGFLYSLYLVYYQSFVVGQYCVLCLISAGIVAVLFGLHLADFFTYPDTAMSSSERAEGISAVREVSVLSSLVLLVFLLAGADVLYFNSLDQRSRSVSAEAEPAARQAGGRPATQAPSSPAVCRYDPEKSPIEDYASLVQFTDPTKGSHDAPVTVIEYLDPNCPHCENLHPIMQKVAAEQKDQARFVYKLFPLRRSSIPQIMALRIAAENDKFFEMLEAQFDRQGVLSVAQLREIAQEIGMNPDKMVRRMQQESLVKQMLKERKAAFERGVDSTPTVIINGRVVASRSRTEACLNQLIEEAAAQAQESG